MPNQKYDYTALRNEFIRKRISIRELGRLHGIPSERISVLHVQAKKKDARGRDWYDLREEYQNRSADQYIEEAAKLEAKRRLRKAEVLDNAIELLDEAFTSVREQIAAKRQIVDDDGNILEVRANPVAITVLPMLIDRIKPLFADDEPDGGLPRGNGDDPSSFLIAGGSGDLGRALLGAIARGTGGGSPVPVGRTVAGSTLPVLEGPRED